MHSQIYAFVSHRFSSKPLADSDENQFDVGAWCGASGRGRTDTPLRELDFESSASANSATEACLVIGYKVKL